MTIRSFEDYKKNIEPYLEMDKFNRIMKDCINKHKDMEFYEPSCEKGGMLSSEMKPFVIIKSRYDGNFYEMPLSELISQEDLKKIDFSKIEYEKCKYFKSLSEDKTNGKKR